MKNMQICPKCGGKITFWKVYPWIQYRGYTPMRCTDCKIPLKIEFSLFPKRQYFITEERYKPLYRADYELFSPAFEKEFRENNILQLQTGKEKFYILLQHVTESDFEFHFVPYQKEILLPEQAELSDGEKIITVLKNIREI